MTRIRLLPLVVLSTAAAAIALLGVAAQTGWMPHGAKPLRLGWIQWATLFVLGWTLMTSAMMLPSSIPFLSAVHRVGGTGASWVAAAGYLAAWGVLGALICAVLWMAGDAVLQLPPGSAENIAGVSLLTAAAYQLTPLARKCQRTCARPFAILARHWHGDGARMRGALASGLDYGVNCIGCCVAMIVLMIVVGLNDLLWMLVLAALMVVQKHVYWGRWFALITSAALGAAGLAIITGWWMPPLHGLRAICGG